MANGTTSLNSLPSNPASGNLHSKPVTSNNNTMKPNIQELQHGPPPQMQQGLPPQMQRGPPPQQNMHHGSPPRQQSAGTTPIHINPSNNNNNMMEQINNDLVNAKNTKLPPRDIPMSTERIMHDHVARPNIIERRSRINFKKDDKPKEDFVKNYETAATIKEKKNKKEEKKDNLDYLYEELQAPILIGFMFFILQLPIVRKKLLAFFPFLFLKDGNMNMSGFVVLSMTFASLYYGIQKFLCQFSTIKI